MTLFGGVISISNISTLLMVVFAVLMAGDALGRITVKGISLGDAGVFIVALLFGCLFFKALEAELPAYTEKALKIVENLGLILFVTSVGFIAGPKFFGNFKKNVLEPCYVAFASCAACRTDNKGRFVRQSLRQSKGKVTLDRAAVGKGFSTA